MRSSTDLYLQLTDIVTKQKYAIWLTVALLLPSFSIRGYKTSSNMSSKCSWRTDEKTLMPSSNRHVNWMLLFSSENGACFAEFLSFTSKTFPFCVLECPLTLDVLTFHTSGDKYSVNMSVTHVRRLSNFSLENSKNAGTKLSRYYMQSLQSLLRSWHETLLSLLGTTRAKIRPAVRLHTVASHIISIFIY